jgi:hypothetical protein
MTCLDGKRHYSVTSPEVGAKIRITDDGDGPIEYWCEWALVLAANKREAKLVAVRGETEDGSLEDWVKEARNDCINPFSGLKVEPSVCEHGVCWGCKQDCIACHKADNLAFLGLA